MSSVAQARIQVGMGPAGERVRVVEREAEVEVYYGTYRVRCVPTALLSRDRRS